MTRLSRTALAMVGLAGACILSVCRPAAAWAPKGEEKKVLLAEMNAREVGERFGRPNTIVVVP